MAVLYFLRIFSLQETLLARKGKFHIFKSARKSKLMEGIVAEICRDLLLRSPKAAIPRLSKAVPGIKRALLQF